jgi:hypothetical protein
MCSAGVPKLPLAGAREVAPFTAGPWCASWRCCPGLGVCDFGVSTNDFLAQGLDGSLGIEAIG